MAGGGNRVDGPGELGADRGYSMKPGILWGGGTGGKGQ